LLIVYILYQRIWANTYESIPHPVGLVLFISNIIVEAHDGKIWGENNADNAIRRALKILIECPFKSESDCAKCTRTFIDVGTIIEYLHKIAAIEILNKAASGQQTEIDQNIQGDRALANNN
jgi:hypothetical protein